MTIAQQGGPQDVFGDGVRRTGWTAVNLALGALLVGLVAAIAITVVRSEDGAAALETAATDWGDRDPNELTQRHRAVAEAAEELTLAFLAVDYRDMDPLIEAVLAGATGEFAEQYAASSGQLIESAQQNRSISVGEVVALGVGALDQDSARVYVAADSEVENVSTDGARQPRYYRLQLGMVREDGEWLAASVRFVG